MVVQGGKSVILERPARRYQHHSLPPSSRWPAHDVVNLNFIKMSLTLYQPLDDINQYLEDVCLLRHVIGTDLPPIDINCPPREDNLDHIEGDFARFVWP